MGIYRFIYPLVTRGGLGLGGRQSVASSGYNHPSPRQVALTFTPLTFLPQLLSVTLTLMHLVLFALVSLSFSPIKPFAFVLAWCFLLHHG